MTKDRPVEDRETDVRYVLERVQSGELSSEEAEELLEALESRRTEEKARLSAEKATRTARERHEVRPLSGVAQEIRDQLKRAASDIRREIELNVDTDGIREGVKGITEGMNEVLTEIGESIRESIPAMAEWGSHDAYVFTDEWSGKLSESNPQVKLDCHSGGIEIGPSQTDETFVTVETRVSARDEETAASRKKDTVSMSFGADGVRVSAKEGSLGRVGVFVKIRIPPATVADLGVNAHNAKSSIEGIAFGEATLNHYNGKLSVRDVRGTKLKANAYNGKINCDSVMVETVALETYNGRISGRVVAEDLTVKAYNGKMDLELGVRSEGTHTIEAYNGKINVSLIDAEKTDLLVEAETRMGKSPSGAFADAMKVTEFRKPSHPGPGKTVWRAEYCPKGANKKLQLRLKLHNGSIVLEKA